MKKIHMEGELPGDYYKAEEVDQLKKEIKSLKDILLYGLKKYDLCELCKIKGQILPQCKSNSNKKCYENMLKLWEAKK